MKVKYVIDGKDYVTLPAYEILEDKYNELEEENKKLKEKLQWWKDLVQKAKEFEYDEDGMDYIWQQTKI